MTRTLFVLFAIVAVGGGAWFLIPDDQPISPEHAPPSWTPPSVETPLETSAPDLTVAARDGERTPVQVEPAEPEAEDPCASVQAELAALIVVCGEHERTIAQLNEKLAATMRERDRLTYDVDTPYGAFLASYEADEIHDPNSLVRIEDWLKQFPVFLGVGEATWIAERTAAKDWKLYGRTSEVALIMFLGPDRLAAELPATRMAELRAYYADESIFK